MLDPLYVVVATLLKFWHTVFASFLPTDSGPAWVLAIIALAVTVRALLLPLAARQVRSQRAQQQLQPEIDELRARYGQDRRQLGAAIQALQRERGVNPLAGCLATLLPLPVFAALFHTLRRISAGAVGRYGWSTALTRQAAAAGLAGVPLFGPALLAGGDAATAVVAFGLALTTGVLTYATQIIVQRSTAPVTGQAAVVQRLLRHGLPVAAVAAGLLFPVGLLLYWATSALWTLGQQRYLLRRFPPPDPAPVPG